MATIYHLKCQGCGEPLTSKRPDRRFHNDKCRKHYNKYIRPVLENEQKQKDKEIKQRELNAKKQRSLQNAKRLQALKQSKIKREQRNAQLQVLANTELKKAYLSHHKALQIAKFESEQKRILQEYEMKLEAFVKLCKETLETELIIQAIQQQEREKEQKAQQAIAELKKRMEDRRKAKQEQEQAQLMENALKALLKIR